MRHVSERPGRYQRSFNGLLGALLICLLVIAGFVAFRAINRDDLSVRPEPIDLAGALELGQSSGVRPVYPDPVPDGWKPISFDVEPKQSEDGPAWGLGFHTEDGSFAGVRRDRSDAETLVDEYVDEDAVEGDEVTIESPLAETWVSWTDEGGDTAYVAESRGQTLIVWGSASADELQDLIGDLTEERVTPRR